jgi:hypothetical protein
MAGKAIQRTRLEQLDKLGEDAVFRTYLEQGSVAKMCRALFAVSEDSNPGADAFYDWLDKVPERKARYERVKLQRADLHADMAVDAAMTATMEDVQVKRLQHDAHKWMAGILNREYRPGQSNVQVNVGVQFGAAWLAGLEKVGQPETIKAEVVE